MKRLIHIALIIVIFAPYLTTDAWAQDPDPRIAEIIEAMSVEERVGQLFLVTYMGQDVDAGSDIARLINDYKVGGVILSPQNGNFENNADAPEQVAKLSRHFQSLALSDAGSGIPLFIALQADGDGAPHTWLRSRMTNIPSPLALGATWNPENARAVGEIVGRELSAVGVNLLLGPPLDVLSTPRPGQPGDLKTRSFGGSPYWVGRLGQAYIEGVHMGSQGRLATVAKHFPGHGSSDRSPDEEAATVEKSAEEMIRTDLAPFLKVTNPQQDNPLAVTDALMTSHLRYRGFQGPSRPGSPPISFDPGGLQAIMELPALSEWRTNGVLVSGPLGVPAVRRHFSPALESFPHKEIAQKALLAGNDLLYVSRFALQDGNWQAQFANIISAILFFREKYENDETFQARVDEALVRIISLKLKLYPQFTPDVVLIDDSKLSESIALPEAKSRIAKIAQAAVAVVAPGLSELADRLPTPPRSQDIILIFTDARPYVECPGCTPFPLIPEEAIEETILRLYGPGPGGTGQIDPRDVHSFSFEHLKAFLIATAEEQPAEKPPEPALTDEELETLETLLEEADWILFGLQDINPAEAPASDALRLFLQQRFDSLTNKKVIVFAYGAPYYLDATEISKLTAYYGVFSKIPASIEASVRTLFQEFKPTRGLPVSVPSITYDLNIQLQPDPNQKITISLIDAESTTLNLGDDYTVQTSVILDRNGHPVPDDTKVTFILEDPTNASYLNFQEAFTVNGIAALTFIADRAGAIEIRVKAGDSQLSDPISLTIKDGTEEPTPVPEPATPTPNLESTPAPIPTATSGLDNPIPTSGVYPVGWDILLLSILGMLLAGMITMAVDTQAGRALPQTFRLFLLSLIAGLSGYLLVGLEWLQIRNLPGLSSVPAALQTPLFSTLMALIPLAYALWDRRKSGFSQ